MNFSADLSDNITQEFYRLEPHLNDAVSSFVWEIERTEHMQEERQGAARAQVRSKYYVGFEGFYPEEVRALNCSHLGKLTCMKGTVTRTTEVRPELIMGVFRCKGCDTLSPKIPQQFKYTEPKKCRRVNCDSNRW
jgi:DNA replication licensing factor MCM6